MSGLLRWFEIPPAWTQKRPETTLGWTRRKPVRQSCFGLDMVILMEFIAAE